MLISKIKKIIVAFLVVTLLVTQMNVDVVRGEVVKVRYGLVAVLVSEEVAKDKVIQSKVVRYAQDAQGALPNSKFLLIQVPSGTRPDLIQSVLEKFYYEGDGASGEYNKLIGTVLVGDISLPVVRKGKEMFPSIYPYVDFYRKAYIYDSNKDLFLENSLENNPIPEIWHGIIKPPVGGEEGKNLLVEYFDKNHDFYLKKNEANIFDKKVFFADFFHEKRWIQNEALRGYEARMEGLELDAYSRFTGGLLKELQDEREVRQRAEGLDVVYDLLNEDDVLVPDIHSVHMIREMWKEFYEAGQKFVSEVNTFVENSGRWNATDADTPISLISKKDKSSQQVIYGSSNVLEEAIDTIVEEIQSEITLIDQYSTALGTKKVYVNGARVDTLNSAQDCSLFPGTFDISGESQLVEANRTYNPNTADSKSGYSGCYFSGNCNPDGATKPIKDLTGTEKIERVVYPDYRECLERVTIKDIPSGSSNANFVQISSVVKHVDPTGPVLTAQLEAGFSKYLPIDEVRYTTYQAHDYLSRRLDYPTHDLWAIEDRDHQIVKNKVLQILNKKNDEINESIAIGNIGSFKSYLARRVRNNFDIDSAFANWKSQTLNILKGIFTGVDSDSEVELFGAYMLGIGDLTQDQKNALKGVYDSVFGSAADPYDNMVSCLGGLCGVGSFEKVTHRNLTTFHDFLGLGGDTVLVDGISVSANSLVIFPIKNPQQKFIFEVSGLLPEGFLTQLIDDEKLNILTDAIAWKNMTVEEKHKYILEKYFGSDESYFFGPEYGYEATYLVADGDSTSLDLSIQKGYSVDDDSEFSELQNDIKSQISDLEVSKGSVKQTRADVRCAGGGAEDGVPLLEWIPYVFCWAEDALTPPYVIYSEEEEVPESETSELTLPSGAPASAKVFPEKSISIELKADKKEAVMDDEKPIQITFEIKDHEGNILNDLAADVVFDILQPNGGSFSKRVVEFEKGRGATDYFPGLKTGKIEIVATHPGWLDGKYVFDILPGKSEFIKLSSSEESLNIFSDDTYQVDVAIYDKAHNVVTTDNETRVNFRVSDLTKGMVDFETEVQVSKGVAQISLSSKRGKAGEVHLIAESKDLVSGLLVVPLKAKLLPEQLKKINLNSLYGSVMGAPIGDSTREDYLAGWFVFSGKTQALSAVSRKKNDLARMFTVGQNGFLEFDNEQNLDVRYEHKGQDKISVYSNDGDKMGAIVPVLSGIEKITIQDEGVMPETYEKGITVIPFEFPGFKYEKRGDSVEMMDEAGQIIMKVGNGFDMEIYDNIFSVIKSENVSDSLFAFDIKNGSITMATIVFNVDFPEIKTTDDLLVSDDGLYVKLDSKNLEARSIFTGSSSNGPRGLEINDTKQISEREYGFRTDGVEDIFEKPGLGWKSDYKNMLLYASGESAGESTKHYLSDVEFLFGDPVVSLRLSSYYDESDKTINNNFNRDFLNPAGFDKTIGNLIHRDQKGTISDLVRFDFNNDGIEDVALISTDGIVELMRGISGDLPLETLGVLLKFPDRPKYIYAGDFQHDQYDDLIALMPDGTINLQANDNKHFSSETIDLDLKNITGFSVADMNKDSYSDLIVSDKKGDIYIVHGSGDGFKTSNKIGDLGIEINSSQELNATTYVYYPGMQDPQFDTYECYGKTSVPSCDAKNYRESYYIPEYVRQQYNSEEITASDTFDRKVSEVQAGVSSFPEMGELFETFSNLIDKQSDNDLAESFIPSYVYYLKGSVDDNLAITKRVSLQNGMSGELNPDDPLHFRIAIRNDSNHTISNFSFADVLSSVYKLKPNTIKCEKCLDAKGEKMIPNTNVNDYSFIYDSLKLKPGDDLEISYDAFAVDIPGLTFIVGDFDMDSGARLSEDGYPDLQVKPEGSLSEVVIYFVSQGSTGSYEMKVVSPAGIEQPSVVNDIKDRASKTPDEFQQEARGFFDSFGQDDDGDGIPNIFDIALGLFQIGKAFAQDYGAFDEEAGRMDLSGVGDVVTAGLNGLSDSVAGGDEIVESVLKNFTCASGCLALPINMDFLSPGMTNVLGVPSAFTPGLAVFSLVPPPVFITPGSNPASYFRFYASPTLNLGLGLGFCFGPYLAGKCITAAVPVAALMGDFCEEMNGTLGAISSGVANFKYDALNETDLGVVSISASGGATGQMSDETIGMEYGVNALEVPAPSTGQVSTNKSIPSFPSFISNWWDKQLEEFTNSLYDFPDIIIYYPDFSEMWSSKTRHQRNALVEQFETVSTYDDFVKAMKNVPIIDLDVVKITIKLPMIFEPNIWDKIESDLESWWLGFLEEVVDFLDSFREISCGTLDVGSWVGLRETLIEKKKVDPNDSDSELEASYIEKFQSSDDLATQISAFNQILEYRKKSFGERYEDALLGYGDDPSAQQGVDSQSREMQEKLEKRTEKIEKFTDKDVGQCLVGKIGIDVLADISELTSSLEENFRVLQEYRKFPRELVKYYDLLGNYLGDVTNFLDKAFVQLSDWMNKNLDRIILWQESASAFEEYVIIFENIIKIFENYKTECSLCKSDRFTLKDFMLKLFVAFPEIPVVPMPNWPDFIMDFSEGYVGIPISLPVFDIVFDGGINWPGIPKIELPKLNELDISLGFNLGAQFNIPGIPVLPAPPDLPDIASLFKLPELPELRLPVAPLPPKLPDLFDWIMPIMDTVKVFMKIVCLLNQSLIPVEETMLKTQIENLTARPMDPLLPLDLSLAVDPKPMNVFESFPDFFKLKTKIEFIPRLYGANSALMQLVKDVVNTWNNVFVDLFAQVNEKSEQISKSLSEMSRSATEAMRSHVDALELKIDADIEVDISAFHLFDKDYYNNKKLLFDKKVEKEISELNSDISGGDEMQNKITALKSAIQNYQEYTRVMSDENELVANLRKQPSLDNLYSLASSVTASNGVSFSEKEIVPKSDVEIIEKRISLFDNKLLSDKILAQSAPDPSPGAGGNVNPQLVLNGLYIVNNDQIHQLTKYNDESSEEGDVLIYDFDNDGDADVLYSISSDIYFKKSENSAKSPRYYPQVPALKNLEDFIPQNKAVNMFRPLGDRNEKSTAGWLSDSERPYQVFVKDTIDGFEYDGDTKSFFVTNDKNENSRIVYYDDYKIIEKTGEVKISSLSDNASVVHPDDLIDISGRGSLIIEVAPDIHVEFNSGSQVKVPLFAANDLRVRRGKVIIHGDIAVLNNGYHVETKDAEVVFDLGKYRLTVPKQSLIDIPPIEKSSTIFLGFDGNVHVNSRVRSLCMAKETCEVVSGDFIHALFDVSLEVNNLDLPLKQGYGFTVEKDSEINVRDGVVEIIHNTVREEMLPYYGMKIFPGDTFDVHSSFHILYNENEYFFREGGVEMVSVPDGKSITENIALPNGYHYGRVIQYDALANEGTYSAIEHFSPHQEDADPLFVNDYREEEIAIFAKRTLSAEPYLELATPDQVFWDLDVHKDNDDDGDPSNDRDTEGMNCEFGPYYTVGIHDIVINVASPGEELMQKPISLKVFVPKISLSEVAFSAGQIEGEVDPPISSYPVSIVRERPNIAEILNLEADQDFVGPDEYKKYYTNSSGKFALKSFDLTKGWRILDNDRNEIVRILEKNGRVIINPSLAENYRLKVYPSTDNFSLRIAVLTADDRVITSVYFVPEIDSDVFIDDYLTEYSKDNVKTMHGVHLKNINSDYDLENIPGDAGFYPGGAVIKNMAGIPISYISSKGDVNFAADGLSLRIKFTFDDFDPVIFELLDNNEVIAELFISGDFTQMKEVGSGSIEAGNKYFDSNKNKILDTWERVYGFTGDPQMIASGDPDGDTLTNLEEYEAGTNPYLGDTDRDGIPDNIEVRANGDALSEFSAEHQFNDVFESSSYFQAVQRLYKEGIIKGFDDNTYRPNQPIKRAELIKIILGTTSCESCVNPNDETKNKYNPELNNPDLFEFNNIAAGGDKKVLAYEVNSVPASQMIHYPDVLWRDWFYYCVEIATEMGVVHGYKGEDDLGRNATGLFLPLENISRAEAVKVFLEAADFSILSSRVIFDERDEDGNNISEGWYYGPELNYIFTAVEFGLLEPEANGRVYPERKITRGEMAEMAFKVLNKLIERFQDEDFDNDKIKNKDDACICLMEDYDQLEDEDGCPERATQLVEIPSVDLPKDTGVYIAKEDDCQLVEPIADAVNGNVFYAIISDFENKKVWRKSNELIWSK